MLQLRARFAGEPPLRLPRRQPFSRSPLCVPAWATAAWPCSSARAGPGLQGSLAFAYGPASASCIRPLLAVGWSRVTRCGGSRARPCGCQPGCGSSGGCRRWRPGAVRRAGGCRSAPRTSSWPAFACSPHCLVLRDSWHMSAVGQWEVACSK